MLTSPSEPGGFDSARLERLRGLSKPWSLGWYALWRGLGTIVVLFVVLTIIFAAFDLGETSGGFAPGFCNGPAVPPRCSIAQEAARFWGFDQPLPSRYLIFLTHVLTGNFGPDVPVYFGMPIGTVIANALPRTLAFVAVILLLVALVGLPLGSFLRRRKGRPSDTVASLLLALPFAVPAALLYLLFLWEFAVVYPVFPLPGATGTGDFVTALEGDVLTGLIVLGMALGLAVWAIRDHPLRPAADPGSTPPIREPFGRRLWNAVPRFLAALPILLPWTLAAVLLVEVVGNINGVGLLLWNGALTVDFPLVMSITVVLALLLLLVLFVADVLHYAMTRRWERADGARVEDLRVNPADAVHGTRKVLLSVLGLAGIALILAMVLLTAAGPYIAGPYPTGLDLTQPRLPPSASHPFGTDSAGRDVFALLLYGGQSMMVVALVAFAFALAIELGLVAAHGLLGDRAAPFLVLPIDAFLVLSIPFAFLLTESTRGYTTLAPALLGWPLATRLLMLETTGLVPNAPGRGGSGPPVVQRGRRTLGLVWGTGPLILGDALFAVSIALLASATLAFVGLGSVGPYMTWGQLVSLAYIHLDFLSGTWWTFVFPILAIFGTILGPVLLGLRLKQLGLRIEVRTLPAPPEPVVPEPSVPKQGA